MGVLLLEPHRGSSNTMAAAPPKKKWIRQHYMQGEEPKDFNTYAEEQEREGKVRAVVVEQEPVYTDPTGTPFIYQHSSVDYANSAGDRELYGSRMRLSPTPDSPPLVPNGLRQPVRSPPYPGADRPITPPPRTCYDSVHSNNHVGSVSSRRQHSPSHQAYLTRAPQEDYRSARYYDRHDLTSSSSSRSHRLEEALLRGSGSSTGRYSPPYPTASSYGSPRSGSEDISEGRKRGGAGTREVHNKLEKNRRAHLRECFEFLRKQLPSVEDKKLSNLGILKSALRCIQSLKRKEREYEHTMERLARDKIAAQQRLAGLRKEVSTIPGYSSDPCSIDLGNVLPAVLHTQHQIPMEDDRDAEHDYMRSYASRADAKSSPPYGQFHPLYEDVRGDSLRRMEEDRESNSTSTASERGDFSDGEETVKVPRKGHPKPVIILEEGLPHRFSYHETFRTSSSASSSPAMPPTAHVISSRYRKMEEVDMEQRQFEHERAKEKESEREMEQDKKSAYLDSALLDSGTERKTTLRVIRTPAMVSASAGLTSGNGTTASFVSGANEAGEIKVEADQPVYVRQTMPLTFSTGSGMVLHPNLQLLNSSLKVLTPSQNLTGMTGVRVISASEASTTLQPLIVHSTAAMAAGKSSSSATYTNTVSANLINGAGTTSFCIPAGVVIPGLVALPSEHGRGPSPSDSRLTDTLKVGPSGENAVIPNGLMNAKSVGRVTLQPTTSSGVTRVVTPLGVSRSLPIVTPVTMVPQAKHVAHILSNSSLEKVMTGPLLKTTIPLLSSQYHSVIKPLVVVATPTADTPTCTTSSQTQQHSRYNSPGSSPLSVTPIFANQPSPSADGD